MKSSFIFLSALLAKVVYPATYIGGLYENPDACEYTDEYGDGFGCDNLEADTCCYKQDSLYGSGDIIRQGSGSAFLVTLASKRQGDYCEIFLGNGPKCVTGGTLQVASGVFYTFNDVLAMEETNKTVVKRPMKSQEAELALFGPEHIYFISNAKLAELEAQGMGKPQEKEARIEWFKKHHTNKISALDADQPPCTPGQKLKVALIRPWVFLFREPIVLIASIYVVIIYGTMYLNFAAYPIVFQRARGWGPGLGGVAFTGTAIGVVLATIAAYVDYKYYIKMQKEKNTPILPPEYRLRSSIVGSFLVPIGLFWFAWTSQPSIHWIVPIIGSVFFACGLVMVFMSLLNYLVDSYVVYAASVMAANSVLRSVFGAAFPLFTIDMYENLGLQWAGSIPGFLALACIPFPLIFYKYGAHIRMKCKFAAEAANILDKMMKQSAAAKNKEATEQLTHSEPETV